MSGKKLKYKDKSSIRFVAHEDPPFIAEIKEKLGYKPPPTIENKFSTSAGEGYVENDLEEDDLLQLKKEDRPQIVILDSAGDLTENDLEKELEKKRTEEDRRKIEERKIVFRKPVKRKDDHFETKKLEKRRHTGNNNDVASNSRLLSFSDGQDI
ncbi:unnamed protein product [Thelazia callipaeda]|uniref:DUF4604 domain-containing protein n=1 Tax=Thelazia callipaeda TaxID=103827 RepID=A0A0N5D8R8_THECL|nr:unnamed protein product [Thelazia callipaeda]